MRTKPVSKISLAFRIDTKQRCAHKRQEIAFNHHRAEAVREETAKTAAATKTFLFACDKLLTHFTVFRLAATCLKRFCW